MKSFDTIAVRLLRAALVAALIVCARAQAQTARRTAIALVEGGGGPELEARLRAELSGIGWRVVETDPEGDVALAKIARRAGTLAVVRIGREGDGIEIWVAPEISAEASSEWIDADADKPALAVVRAVEALRARFLELGIEPEAAPLSAPPSEPQQEESSAPEPGAAATASAPARAEPVESTAEPESTPKASRTPATSSLWLRAQGALSGSPGGLGISRDAIVGARLRVGSSISAGAELWLSPARAEVGGDGGSASIRRWFGALSIEVEGRGNLVFGGLGMGLGGVLLDVDGDAEPGYVEKSERITALVPFGRVLGGLVLAERLRLRLDASAGVSFPRARVVFAGKDVAFWGRPLIGAGLGLDWLVWD